MAITRSTYGLSAQRALRSHPGAPWKPVRCRGDLPVNVQVSGADLRPRLNLHYTVRLEDRALEVETGDQTGVEHLAVRGHDLAYVAYADMPFVSPATLRGLRQALRGSAAAIATGVAEETHFFGRIVRDDLHRFLRTAEDKDATPEEKAEIGRLTVELEALWERHRMELTRPPATARPISRGVTRLRRSSAA